MKLALVYQAGIANVFEVKHYGLTAAERNRTRRLLQHSFDACDWFVRGAIAAGAVCEVYGCNMAGDIADCDWVTGRDLENLPFSKDFLRLA